MRLVITERTGLLLAMAVVLVAVASSNAGSNVGVARAADPPAYFAGDDIADTAVSIVGEKFEINGTPTNPQMFWGAELGDPGDSVEGMLLNSRMVNGIYDDMDGVIHPDMQPWDPRANTDDFIAKMQEWAEHGLNAIAMNMQGGSNECCNYKGDDQIGQGVLNNPFGTTGTQAFDEWAAGGNTPRSDYLHRLGSIIRHADDLGMVVMLGLFYFGQDDELADEAAVEAAVDATARWVIDNGWTNVMIEITNETIIIPSPENVLRFYNHDNLQVENVATLIERVQDYCDEHALDPSPPDCSHLPSGQLLVSTSLGGGLVPDDDIIAASDFVLLHGNGQNSGEIRAMVDDTRASAAFLAAPKPIVFNEDSTTMANFDAAIEEGTSWGYYDQPAYQTVFPTTEPNRWAVERQTGQFDFCDSFWARTAAATTTATGIPYRLAVSTEQTRVRSTPLDGMSITGDIFVHVEPSLGVTRAYFWLDSPGPIDETDIGTELHSEGVAPLDFSGGSLTCANSFDTTAIADGNDHTITALLVLDSGPAQTITATFNPGEAPADITGDLQLKGVSDQAKFAAANPRVTITPVGGTESAPVAAVADGSISLPATLPGNYTLKAYADGYLPAETAPFLLAGDPLAMPPVTLRGGDMNSDDNINGADISVLLGAFGSSTADRFVDLNGDGFVTMIDASILISNFPATGPDPWSTP